MNTCGPPYCSVTSTVELMTHRTSGTTYVILGERATAPDGGDLGYDIYQAAGPLSARESRLIRQYPLGWRPDPGVNIDRLLQTLQSMLERQLVPTLPHGVRNGREDVSKLSQADSTSCQSDPG